MPMTLSLLLFFALVFAAAATGAQFQPGPWYASLAKPSWTPPGWLFGPVWTVLYIGIATAGWLVWRHSPRMGPVLWLWGVQLVLNALWSWLFFGLHRPGLALVDILLLLVTIAAFVALSMPVSRLAAWLFVPYLLWVGFASALNFSIWRLNSPGAG